MLKKTIAQLNIHRETFAVYQKSTKIMKFFSRSTFVIYRVHIQIKIHTKCTIIKSLCKQVRKHVPGKLLQRNCEIKIATAIVKPFNKNVTGSGKTSLIATTIDIHFCLQVKAALMHYPETPSTYLVVDGLVCFH